MTLTQLQQEAHKEFDEKFPVTFIRELDDYIAAWGFMDSLTARVYAAALEDVESGMPIELDEAGITPADQVQGERQKEAQNKEIGLYHGWNLARKELLSHLRTLREGITGNEKNL